MEESWYKLDNAAKIYPAIRESDWAPVYRMNAILKEKVNKEILQLALNITYKRFPTFSVHFTKGLFWYYFEPIEALPEARMETDYPAAPFSDEKDKGYLFRVLYFNRRISLEVFHSITDGFGATVFLKTLIFNYLTLANGIEPIEDVLDLDKYNMLYYKDLPNPEESEDSFLHVAAQKDKLDLKESTAFKIKGTPIKKNTIKVLHAIVKVNSIKILAKKFDATITELLTAIFIESILKARLYDPSEKRPIKISVPINLRKRFLSKTLRNFSSYVNVEYKPDMDIENIELIEICKEVSRQIRQGTELSVLKSRFSGNVNAEKNIFMRLAPLFLKNIVLKINFGLYGERLTTSTISNIGNIVLPENMSSYIERFDFVLGEPKENAYNCAVISFNNIMSVSFTSNIVENAVTKAFIDTLVGYGVAVDIEANY